MLQITLTLRPLFVNKTQSLRWAAIARTQRGSYLASATRTTQRAAQRACIAAAKRVLLMQRIGHHAVTTLQ